jgi:hypothetical protein
MPIVTHCPNDCNLIPLLATSVPLTISFQWITVSAITTFTIKFNVLICDGSLVVVMPASGGAACRTVTAYGGLWPYVDGSLTV